MTKGSDNSFGIAAVILGILSITLSINFIVFGGLILGFIGLVFALIQRRNLKNKWVLWGLILSVAGIIIGLVLAALFLSAIAELAAQLQESGALEGIQNGMPNA